MKKYLLNNILLLKKIARLNQFSHETQRVIFHLLHCRPHFGLNWFVFVSVGSIKNRWPENGVSSADVDSSLLVHKRASE